MLRSLLHIGVFAIVIGCTDGAGDAARPSSIEPSPPSTDPPPDTETNASDRDVDEGDTGSADHSDPNTESSSSPDSDETPDGNEDGGSDDTGVVGVEDGDTGLSTAEAESDHLGDEAEDTGTVDADDSDSVPTAVDEDEVSTGSADDTEPDGAVGDTVEDPGDGSASDADGETAEASEPPPVDDGALPSDEDTGTAPSADEHEPPMDDAPEDAASSAPTSDAGSEHESDESDGGAVPSEDDSSSEPSSLPVTEPAPGDACGDGWILDCGMVCTLDLFVGDGICDDASRPFGDWFACPQLDWDGGDCPVGEWPPPEPPGDLGESCGDGMVLDCDLECNSTIWLGDGWCDDETSPYGIHFDCDFFDADDGDCESA